MSGAGSSGVCITLPPECAPSVSKTLVRTPETTLGELGRWLGVPLDGDLSRLATGREWTQNSSFDEELAVCDPRPVERWRSAPQDAQPLIDYAGSVAARELRSMGYDAPARTTPLRALKYARRAWTATTLRHAASARAAVVRRLFPPL